MHGINKNIDGNQFDFGSYLWVDLFTDQSAGSYFPVFMLAEFCSRWFFRLCENEKYFSKLKYMKNDLPQLVECNESMCGQQDQHP